MLELQGSTKTRLLYADHFLIRFSMDTRSGLGEVGVFDAEGPPVPIPNTEVKLISADDTCLATGRENRSTPTQGLWQRSKPLI